MTPVTSQSEHRRVRQGAETNWATECSCGRMPVATGTSSATSLAFKKHLDYEGATETKAEVRSSPGAAHRLQEILGPLAQAGAMKVDGRTTYAWTCRLCRREPSRANDAIRRARYTSLNDALTAWNEHQDSGRHRELMAHRDDR